MVIFGGDHADLPLAETAGELLADLVVDERVPAVLDLSTLSKSAARRFMTDFAERLFIRTWRVTRLLLGKASDRDPVKSNLLSPVYPGRTGSYSTGTALE